MATVRDANNSYRSAVRNTPTTFWGKLRPARDFDGTTEWHPLADHCADVAAVVEALLCLPLWRQRLLRLAGRDISAVGWARLCVLAVLHDIGKLNIGFQAKGRPELGPTAGHVIEAIAALFKPVFKCLSALQAWGDAVVGLMIAAVCHHGRPYNAHPLIESAWQESWWTPRGGLDPRAGAEDLLARCRRWFPAAFEDDGSTLPDTPAFAHAFAGLLMLADWIGSDTQFFPFSEEGAGDRMAFARPRAQEAVRAMGLDIALSARADTTGREAFARVASPNYQPRPAQAAMLRLPNDKRGSITTLESETGSGKTEAVLARFVTLFEAGDVDGLYFALPTRSAATQIYQRVYEAVQRAFTTPPAVVLAVPGYLRVDDIVGQKLAPFDVLWPDQDPVRFRFRAWASENAKRYLAGCIVVGTIDQVLLSSLMVGHAHLRAAALLRHLLVVDEVHASDAYMGRILEDVLTRHWAAGGHAILLSATLGSEARTRLLHPGERVTPPPLTEAGSTPYPLISHRGDDVLQSIAVANDGTPRVIDVSSQPWLDRPDAAAVAAVDAALEGAKVLIIKNTVVDCIAVQIAVERLAKTRGCEGLLFQCDGIVAPHHARFARPDRERLDSALETRYGKKRSQGGCVLVATQTVQQSLDLDADLLFTDLCPIDVLLQRLGRLHRHERVRVARFARARTLVMTPESRDLGLLIADSGTVRARHGLGSVYPDLRVLEATWRLIDREPEWQIPAMNRYLVEHSLHSTVLDDITQDGGTRWQAHAMHIMGRERGEARQAVLNLVDWSHPYCEMSFPEVTEDGRILTRLGEGDRRVTFTPPITSPFGAEIDEITVRASWVNGVPSDLHAAEKVSTADGVTHFTFGEHAFTYDRLGLRPVTLAPAEVDEDDGP